MRLCMWLHRYSGSGRGLSPAAALLHSSRKIAPARAIARERGTSMALQACMHICNTGTSATRARKRYFHSSRQSPAHSTVLPAAQATSGISSRGKYCYSCCCCIEVNACATSAAARSRRRERQRKPTAVPIAQAASGSRSSRGKSFVRQLLLQHSGTLEEYAAANVSNNSVLLQH